MYAQSTYRRNLSNICHIVAIFQGRRDGFGDRLKRVHVVPRVARMPVRMVAVELVRGGIPSPG